MFLLWFSIIWSIETRKIEKKFDISIFNFGRNSANFLPPWSNDRHFWGSKSVPITFGLKCNHVWHKKLNIRKVTFRPPGMRTVSSNPEYWLGKLKKKLKNFRSISDFSDILPYYNIPHIYSIKITLISLWLLLALATHSYALGEVIKSILNNTYQNPILTICNTRLDYIPF